jgi:hypothetical protein
VNIAKMDEGLKSGGVLLLVDSLGTGGSTPRPPRPELADYYAWLEGECGFKRQVFRTDYLFPDSETAAQATEFFFGT